MHMPQLSPASNISVLVYVAPLRVEINAGEEVAVLWR